MGRKTKLTTEVHNALITAIRGGNWVETAARYAGISARTLYNWLDRGEIADAIEEEGRKVRKAELPFLHFFRDYTRARAEAEYRNVQNIQLAGAGETYTETTERQVIDRDSGQVVTLRTTATKRVRDWRASAWWLSKSFPDRYGNVEDGASEGGSEGEAPPPVTFIEEDASGIREGAEGEPGD